MAIKSESALQIERSMGQQKGNTTEQTQRRPLTIPFDSASKPLFMNPKTKLYTSFEKLH